MPIVSCIVDRFTQFAVLGAEEIALLSELELDPRSYAAGTVLCKAGSTATQLFTLVKGWAGIVRHFADGRRQVLDLYLPGQIMRLRELGSEQAQSDLLAFTDIVACPFPRERIDELLARPRLAGALLLTLTAEQGLLTERITNVARRPALERMAHFLLELRTRLGAETGAFELPLTQDVIGDMLGLSSVHVSRTLGRLRRLGLVHMADGQVRLLDIGALETLSGFQVGYLSRPGLPAQTAPATPVAAAPQ